MRIYNTLTKEVEEFTPIGETVSIYSCGPTVYDRAHIGNLSAYIYADLLRRVLNSAGHKTKHVMNITDVDDKTIKRSVEKYSDFEPMQALEKLTTDLTNSFYEDMRSVGNDTEAINFVLATENIEQIKDFITNLVNDGYAYKADDGIYFDINNYSKNHKYGQLTHIDKPSDAKARIDNDEYDKESAQDFALWKRQKNGEPAWEFDNIPGRPGWHIECSVMSTLNLGKPFDIHTGGIDLIFPHHENEIAQCEGELARYFVHNGHLMVDGAKMAKSKNNFYTLNDIIDRGHNPIEFRLLVLQGHFQNSTSFSWENLEAVHNRLQSWRNLAELRWQTVDTEDRGQQQIIVNLIDKAKNALFDNLNTPEALKYIDEAVDHLLQSSPDISHQALDMLILFIDTVLGLEIEKSTPGIGQELKDMIAIRQVYRANGDYIKSDEIRDSLLANGIMVKDMADSVFWARK
jgi:cysteinyl-tRNA synthetase